MTVLHRAAFAFLLGAPLVACADHPLPTGSTAGSPKLDFINNLDNGNPMIVRYQAGVAYLVVDRAAGLFSIVASNNDEMGCAVRTWRVPADVQRVLAAGGEDADMIHALRLAREVWITVYSPIPDELDCAQLPSLKLAQGFGQLTATDNDVNAPFRVSNNSNAFGMAAQGTLDLLAGGTAQYNALQRCVWDGEDLNNVRCVQKINLH